MTGGLRALLDRPVDEAAPLLLGWMLTTEVSGEITSVRLTEVEAYGGADDPASHAFRGRTPRNGSMFGPGGRLYVYRSYGIHWCTNVVTGPEGNPSAVLLRAGVPIEGRAIMEKRRGRAGHLTDGPGKLTQALGITGEHDGTAVGGGPIRLMPGEPPGRIDTTPRIGISRAKECPWRFVAAAG